MNTSEKTAIAQRYKALIKQIDYHDEKYHGEDNPKITDSDYDALRQELSLIESNHPDLKAAHSPSEKVGASPVRGFNKIQHSVPMLSLSNVFSEEDLEDFIVRTRKFLGLSEVDALEILAEPKTDGLSCSFRYENRKFLQAATRRDCQHHRFARTHNTIIQMLF